jgi:hypothetical protein
MDNNEILASQKPMVRGKETRVVFVAKNEDLFGIMTKDIGGEIIVKPTFPHIAKHLSLYPEKDGIGHHVTHEKYPRGHRRRHTQKKTANPVVLLNACLELMATPDDPSPRFDSLEGFLKSEQLTGWLERNFRRIVRPVSEQQVIVLRGVLGQLVETMFSLKEGIARLDISELIEIDNKSEKEMKDKLMIEVRENELASMGKHIGFSEDFSMMIVVLENGMVMDFFTESLERASRMISTELGVEGYLRSLGRKEAQHLPTFSWRTERDLYPRK